jgi:hypothetical protein
MLGAMLFVLGCAVPAVLLCAFSRPTRDETDDEWMDRIFAAPPADGDWRCKRVSLNA